MKLEFAKKYGNLNEVEWFVNNDGSYSILGHDVENGKTLNTELELSKDILINGISDNVILHFEDNENNIYKIKGFIELKFKKDKEYTIYLNIISLKININSCLKVLPVGELVLSSMNELLEKNIGKKIKKECFRHEFNGNSSYLSISKDGLMINDYIVKYFCHCNFKLIKENDEFYLVFE